MKDLQEVKLHETFFKARDIIRQVGFTRNMHCDPDTGSVDVEGAFLLALGVKKLPILVVDTDAVLPEVARGRFDACLVLVESEVGDITEWVDKRATQAEVEKLLTRLGNEVAIA